MSAPAAILPDLLRRQQLAQGLYNSPGAGQPAQMPMSSIDPGTPQQAQMGGPPPPSPPAVSNPGATQPSMTPNPIMLGQALNGGGGQQFPGNGVRAMGPQMGQPMRPRGLFGFSP